MITRDYKVYRPASWQSRAGGKTEKSPKSCYAAGEGGWALVRTLSSQLQSNEELLLLHRWSTSHLGLFIGASLFLYLRRGGVQAVCCAHAGPIGG
jgi:hypothetical protein